VSPCRKPCGTHGWPERNRRDGSATAEDEAAVLGRLRTLPTTPTSDTRGREEIPGALEDLVPLSNDFRVLHAASTWREAREKFGYHNLQQRLS
jgi:hypothetical protein